MASHHGRFRFLDSAEAAVRHTQQLIRVAHVRRGPAEKSLEGLSSPLIVARSQLDAGKSQPARRVLLVDLSRAPEGILGLLKPALLQ